MSFIVLFLSSTFLYLPPFKSYTRKKKKILTRERERERESAGRRHQIVAGKSRLVPAVGVKGVGW